MNIISGEAGVEAHCIFTFQENLGPPYEMCLDAMFSASVESSGFTSFKTMSFQGWHET